MVVSITFEVPDEYITEPDIATVIKMLERKIKAESEYALRTAIAEAEYIRLGTRADNLFSPKKKNK